MNVLWPMIEILELKRGEKLLVFINDKKVHLFLKRVTLLYYLVFYCCVLKKKHDQGNRDKKILHDFWFQRVEPIMVGRPGGGAGS